MKKIIGIFLAITVFGANVYAQNMVPDISNCEGTEISVENSTVDEKGAINVQTTILGDSEQKKCFTIGINIFDILNQKISGYEVTRNLDNAHSCPINFYASGIADAARTEIFTTPVRTDKIIAVSQNGSDENPGSKTEPVATLSKALTLAQSAGMSNEYKSVTILIKDGDYNFNQPIDISYSGNIPLSIKAENNDVHFLSGLKAQGADFYKVTDENTKMMFPEDVRNNIYALNLSDLGYNADFDAEANLAQKAPMYTSFYVDGEKKDYASYPNSGWSETATSIWTLQSGAENLTYYDFSFRADDIGDWNYYQNAWVRGSFMEEWALADGAVENINSETKTIKVAKYHSGHFNSTEFLYNNYRTDSKWMIYNLPEALNCSDRFVIYNNVLYYYPNNEYAFMDSSVTLSASTNVMLNLNNCRNLKIEGITFEDSAGNFLKTGNNVNNIEIAGCTFKNNTKDAINVNGNNIKISSCDFYSIDGFSISMKGGDRNTLTSSKNIIENCYFKGADSLAKSNGGAVTIDGCGVTVKKNKFEDMPYGVLKYSGNNHIIEYNDISDCNKEQIGDSGFIHNGNDISNLGTIIRKNYIHDGYSAMAAIYYDDRLSGQTAENNVFENLSGGVLFVHGGVNNKFSGNIVINTDYGVRVRDKDLTGSYYIKQIKNGETVTTKETVNCWDTTYFTGENGKRLLDLGNNLFLLRLMGGNANGITYPSYPWNDQVWQSAYGDTLKYLNNKTTRKAEDITISNNTFVNVTNDTIWTLENDGQGNGMTLEDLDCSGNSDNLTNLPENSKALYNDVKTNSGLYINSYRKK